MRADVCDSLLMLPLTCLRENSAVEQHAGALQMEVTALQLALRNKERDLATAISQLEDAAAQSSVMSSRNAQMRAFLGPALCVEPKH